MTAATDELDRLRIPYRLFRHSRPIESLEQAAAERGELPEQVVRTIVFRLSEGEFALVLMAGPRQVSWPALRRALGQHRLSMASPEEVKQATGYVPGTVSPFGFPASLPSGPHGLPSGPHGLPSSPKRLPSGPKRLPSGPKRLPSGPHGLPSGPKRLRVLVDRSVLAPGEISLGSGERGLAILMAPADLLRALGETAEVGEWGES